MQAPAKVDAVVEAAMAEDAGAIVYFEHLNVTIQDGALAMLFYIMGLGLTRDPHASFSPRGLHVNVGQNQFHIGGGPISQVVPGHIGLIIPDAAALEARLEAVKPNLAGTQFAWSWADGYLAVTCPWGNQFRVYTPSKAFAGMKLGLPYVEFHSRSGTARGIARFYETVMGAKATVRDDRAGRAAHIAVGRGQELIFREMAGTIRPYDGHHVAIYTTDFSAPYRFFKERGQVMEELRNSQWRFKNIIDPSTGELLHELEHEVRSIYHRQWGRQLVNRDLTAEAAQRQMMTPGM